MSLCIVCHNRPAQIPDRDKPGRPIKRICRECHVKRLQGDLKQIMAQNVPHGR